MNKLIIQRTKIVRLDSNDTTNIKSKLHKYTISVDSIVDLGFKDGKYIKQVTFTYYLPIKYEALVNQLVREKYTDSEEFAILRKALTEKTNEFYIYNAFVEECKTQAKAFIEERNKVLGV